MAGDDPIEIRNCGNGPRAKRGRKDYAERAKVRFLFECPVDESSMTATDLPGVKHCGECKRRVYSCETIEEAEDHARAGHCIAVPAELSARAGDQAIAELVVRGMPDGREMWAEKLFPGE